MRLTKVVLAIVLGVAAFSTFADDSPKASFKGTWNGSFGKLILSPSSDGKTVAISGETKINGQTRSFTTTAPIDGDVVAFQAQISNTGFTDRLDGQSEGTDTIMGKAELDPNAGTMQVHWETTQGAAGEGDLTQAGTGWKESYMGGSPEAEAKIVQGLAKNVTQLQNEVADGKPLQRGFHNKGFGLKAQFNVNPSIASDLAVGIFQPGASYEAIVRFSNAGSNSTSDFSLDQRGLAFRIKPGKASVLLSGLTLDGQDFLTTNSPITTPNPVEFLDVARGLTTDKTSLPSVLKKYGLGETATLVKDLSRGTDLTSSMTSEKLWSSRAPFKWGRLAVKFSLTPSSVPQASLSDGPGISGVAKGVEDRLDVKNRLSEDMKLRLENGPVVFDMWIQRFADEKTTPIEDGSVEWKTQMEKVGQLVLTKNADPEDPRTKALADEIEKMSFNPWNQTEDFRPLGSLNRARKLVYPTSAKNRGACPLGFGG
jgi:hypothetical protein